MANVIPAKSKKGFTLVELVVVIAVLAILAAIAIPIVNNLVNAAARNSAVANAQTIDLAVKECKGYIATKVDEVYDGETVINGIRIPSASKEPLEISMKHLVEVKAIHTAFERHFCNGVGYIPYWDTLYEKCVFLGKTKDSSVYQTIQGEEVTDTVGMSFGSRYIALSIEDGEKMVVNGDLKIYLL